MSANFLLTANPNSLTGYRIVTVDATKARTLAGFYQEIAHEMEFPDYFGFNLDSLDELLNDLSWINEGQLAIFISDSGWLLADEPNPEKLPVLLVLLNEAAENRKISEQKPVFPKKELKMVFGPDDRITAILGSLNIQFDRFV